MAKYRVTLSTENRGDVVNKTAVVKVPDRAGTLVIITKAIAQLVSRGHSIKFDDVTNTDIKLESGSDSQDEDNEG